MRSPRKIKKGLSVAAVSLSLGLPVAVLLIITAISIFANDSCGRLTTPPTGNSWEIRDDNLGVEELWRRNGIVQPTIPISRGILASTEAVVVVGYDCASQTAILYSFDPSTGQPLWEKPRVWPFHSIELGEGRLYAAYSWRVYAYTPKEGNLEWMSEVLPGHAGYRLRTPDSDTLEVLSIDDPLGQWEQVIRYYDAHTGMIRRIIRIPAAQGSEIKLRATAFDIWADTNQVWAANVATGDQKWVVEISGGVEDWPILIGTTLVLNRVTQPGLLSIDVDTGLVKWTYPERLASNAVIDAGVLYAVRSDYALVALDPNTGLEVGRAMFIAPDPTEDIRPVSLWITASHGIIFVYIPASQELIALSNTP